MMMTLALSIFIPNTMTILLLMPFIGSISREVSSATTATATTCTMLGLAVIYAANIGGMASLLGSPANALFLFSLQAHGLPTNEFSILRWFAFGIPMALAFLLGAGAILLTFYRKHVASLSLKEVPSCPPKIADANRILCIIMFSMAGPIISTLLPESAGSFVAITVLGATAVLVFLLPLPQRKEPLLRLRDLYSRLPWRGITFMAVAIGLILLTASIWNPMTAGKQIGAAFPPMSETTIVVTLTATTIFATEVLSNSVSAILHYYVVYTAMGPQIDDPAMILLAINLASTCAFMSPISTPATALAFGGLRDLSLRDMLVLGCIINVFAALLIVVCCTYWIPWVLTSL